MFIAVSPVFTNSSFCFATIFSVSASTSFTSFLAKSISGFSAAFVPFFSKPNFSSSLNSRSSELNALAIFSEVSGINEYKSEAPIIILSERLYNTSLRRGNLSSSFASNQGSVSSIYLLQRLNKVNISVIASAARSSFILSTILTRQAVAISLSSLSTGSSTPVDSITPPKYLLLIATVLLTRFPSVLARSELYLSAISSQVITPSFS